MREAASGEREDLGRRAVVMAVADLRRECGGTPVLLPAWHRGVGHIAGSAVALGIAIAPRHTGDLGRRKAWILTFGVLAVAIGVTSAVGVLLPGSGG